MQTLKDFLIENEKLPPDNQLSATRIAVLKLAEKYADAVYKTGKYWILEFDEGVYQGKSVIRLNKQNITPLHLLNALASVNWVGFPIAECNEAILKTLERNT